MIERFIIVPNNIDLAKTLAYHNKSVFNTHIFNPIEFANYCLTSSGLSCDKQYISSSEELIYYFNIVKNERYFPSVKLNDLKNINATINTIRKLVVENEAEPIKNNLLKGKFIDKNKALLNVYDEYTKTLIDNNKIDGIGLIRYALSNSAPISGEILIIKEYKLQPLELQLVKALSNNNYKEVSLFDLFDVKDNVYNINSYKNCYGSSNEVETILNDILSNKKADQCVIACGNYNTYAQIFFDYACKYGVPMGFSDGISIINSYPGKLLKQYNYWQGIGNFGWQPLLQLLYCPYFNFELFKANVLVEDEKQFNFPKFFERLSKLRLTNNIDINTQRIEEFEKAIARKDLNDNEQLEKYVDGFSVLAKELALPLEEFINKYAVIRNENTYLNKLDANGKTTIYNQISNIRNIGIEIGDDVIESLLSTKVLRSSTNPSELYIASVDKALSVLKNNLYICGLSSSYPGSPKENPLLLDSDLEDFNNDDLSSQGKIKDKKNLLLNLIRLASALNNEINLSYAGLNVSELKNNNASSLLFEIYKKQNGDNSTLAELEKQIIKVPYFANKLSINNAIGNAYNNNNEILFNPENKNNNNVTQLYLNEYSPSGLNTFFNCKKQFFYQYLLRIPQADDYDPFEVIAANEQGTLAHALMEYLPDHQMDKKEFIDLAGKAFDEYMNISVPLIKENIANKKHDFLEMLENGYEMDQKYKRRVANKEVDQHTTHLESGIKIHGFPDRVELTDDGKAVIIDFKTERNINAHKKDDIDSCLQVLIYAYIIEKTMNIEVDHCEYRMLRFNNGIITCKYDNEIKQQLSQKLIEFKDVLSSGDFEIAPMSKDEEKDKCKYCKYASICGKEIVENEE